MTGGSLSGMARQAPSAGGLHWLDGLRYGALGAPLAFAALPLYVLLPSHYSGQLGVPLAGLGAVLLALGADLAIPGALLAGVIHRAGHALRHEGSYFGWWTCANKLNLALAAGLALPALQVLGYAPGARDEAALVSLALIYAALPCLLKLAAGALLWHHRFHLGRP